MSDKKNNDSTSISSTDQSSTNSTEDSLELESLKKAVDLLDFQKHDLELALSTVIEHGDIVEEQVCLVNEQLKSKIEDRLHAEETLKRLVHSIGQQKKTMQIALFTAISHCEAIKNQLGDINEQLGNESDQHQKIESQLKSLVNNLNCQKRDLELMVETITSHGDEINSQMEDQLSSIKTIAKTDALTNLWNRGYFDEMFTKEWNRNLRSKTFLSLLMIDIDYFKSFNDTYGHQKGDICLKQVATTLANIPQRSGEFVARYGGEEFVVILPLSNLDNAKKVAEQIRQAVEALQIKQAETPGGYLTVSIGVASMIPQAEQQSQSLFNEADGNLFRAKKTGRNRIVVDTAQEQDK